MRIAYTLLLSSAVILSCIDFSSQFNRFPHDPESPGFNHLHPSDSEHYHGMEHAPNTSAATAMSSTPAEPSSRHRSRSPPLYYPYSKVLGIKIEELPSYRFIPVNNTSQELELRFFTFRPGAGIYLRNHESRIGAQPTGIQIMLSAVNGDGFALLEKRKTSHTVLRGLYIPSGSAGTRAKINIFTHRVSKMETDEVNNIPCGISHPIRTWFTIKSVPAQYSLNVMPTPPPAKPTVTQVLGIKMEEFPFHRFFPINNSSRELELRSYDFRPGTEIYLRNQWGYIKNRLTGSKFVMSGVNGDAFAIVEKQPSGHVILRGIYMPPGPKGLRAKINIFNHHVSKMETEEVNDVPLAKNHRIKDWFDVRPVEN